MNLRSVTFFVGRSLPAGAPRPAIEIDGQVEGADASFDHHVSGESINLLAIPRNPLPPRTIATPLLDGDAVLSAVVLLLRAAGDHAALDSVWPVLFEAAHYCDRLVPSGLHPTFERRGLGLHCWIKSRGLRLRNQLRGVPDGRGHVFRALTAAVAGATRSGTLPFDSSYLISLTLMRKTLLGVPRRTIGRVTAISRPHFIDPMAIYGVATTDFLILDNGPAPRGRHYTIGVHPGAYGRIDLRPVWTTLHELEPGWGGRSNAGGSPILAGSALAVDEIAAILESSTGTG